MKDRERIQAELQAHAAQLSRFCKDSKLGFFIGLTDGEELLRASNVDNASLRRIFSSVDLEPLDESYQLVGRES